MNRLEFSIVITCHNQASYIGDAVNSALLQTCVSAPEVIVVDDGSVDGSHGILEQFADRIKFVQLGRNFGPNVARNLGASMAEGEYLVFLDGDDVLLPWALQCYDRLLRSRKAQLVLSRLYFFKGAIPQEVRASVREKIEFVEYDSFLKKDRSSRTSVSAIVIDRLAFQNVGGWTVEIFPGEELDLLIRLGDASRAIQVVSPPTVCYRVHDKNTIHQVSPILAMLRTIIRKERAGGYPGGRSCRLERRALIGGSVFFWVRRAAGKGLYLDAAKLVAHGLPMVAASAVVRVRALVRGRRPLEALPVALASAAIDRAA